MNTFSPLLKPALALSAISLAAAGQYLHTYYHADILALILFGVALALWLFVVGSSSFAVAIRPRESTSSDEQHRLIPKVLVVSAILLTVFTFFFASGNQLSVDNLLAWSGSLIAFLYSWVELNPSEWRAWLNRKIKSLGKISLQAAALGGIMLMGAFLNVYHLDTVPALTDERYSDRVLTIDNVVNASYAPIFFDQMPGGEPLQFYLIAAFAKVTDMPVDVLMLKLFSATLGVVLIPLTFLLARELFGSEFGLIAAFLVTISKWTLTIARMGLQFILAPVFVAATMLFLVRAFKYRRRNDFIAAGVFLGAGIYGYSAFRIVPLLVLLFVILWFARVLEERRAIKKYIVNSGLMLMIALAIAMPLVRYATEDPKTIAAPITHLIDPSGAPVAANPVVILGQNLVNAAAMFNWSGDTNAFNAVPNDPTLDYVTGALFLLGVAYALYRFVRFNESVYAFLLIGLAILVLPTALNLAHPVENPSIVRAAGAIPFVIILATLPLAWIITSIRTALSNAFIGRMVAGIVLLLLLLVALRANYLRYFVDYASVNQQPTAIFDFRLPKS